MKLTELYLCRHGETLWSLSGQHTSLSDIPLTQEGEKQASSLKKHLSSIPFDLILSSPMIRAHKTALLSGFHPLIEPDATEWNYGDFEQKKTVDIWKNHPNWNIFQDGAPNGESPQDIEKRADRLIHKCKGKTLIFSHGHFLRALAARWLGLPVREGRLFSLNVASISILSFERGVPTFKLWNWQENPFKL